MRQFLQSLAGAATSHHSIVLRRAEPLPRPPRAATFELGQSPTTKESQAVGDELFSDFVSKEVDKVELIYTKFVSLISSEPTVQTLLPLTPQVSTASASCPVAAAGRTADGCRALRAARSMHAQCKQVCCMAGQAAGRGLACAPHQGVA